MARTLQLAKHSNMRCVAYPTLCPLLRVFEAGGMEDLEHIGQATAGGFERQGVSSSFLAKSSMAKQRRPAWLSG